MPEFLNLVSANDAMQKMLDHIPAGNRKKSITRTETAVDKILADDIFAPEESPTFPRSTVDGYAVRAKDTFGANESNPLYFSLIGEAPMGGAPQFSIHSGEAALIHTGGMLPEGADSVVMLENSQINPKQEIEVYRPVAAAENVVAQGEDVSLGDTLFSKGKRLRPVDIGGLTAMGIMQIPVFDPPLVGIISSGDEVVPPEQKPKPGQVRDINSYSLFSLVQRYGGDPEIIGIVRDDENSLYETLKKTLEKKDIVIITAGSSASARDFTARVINRQGKPGVLVHGINIRPGKPTILAVCDGKPVIGLPGNPVSAMVIAQLFAKPIIELIAGLANPSPLSFIAAEISTNVHSQAGRQDWIPVKLRYNQNKIIAEPIFFKSSLIFNLTKADGMCCITEDVTGLEVGENVYVLLL